MRKLLACFAIATGVTAAVYPSTPVSRREIDAEGTIAALQWSPDGSTLAVFRRVVKDLPDHQRSADYYIELWDPAEGKVKKTLIHTTNHDVPNKPMVDFTFTPDGKQLACLQYVFTDRPSTVTSEIQIWDVAVGQKVRSFNGPPATGLNYPYSSTLLKLAYSTDGKLLAACGKLVDHDQSEGSHIGGEVCVWDARTYKLKWDDRTTHTNIVYDVKFTSDSRTLYSGGVDNLVRVWDPGTGRLKKTLFGVPMGGVTTLSLSADDRYLAAGGLGTESGEAAFLWDMKTDKVQRYTVFKRDSATYVGFGPDDTLWAVGQDPNAEFKFQVRSWNAKTQESKGVLGDHDGASMAVAASPDGRTLAVGAHDHILLFGLK